MSAVRSSWLRFCLLSPLVLAAACGGLSPKEYNATGEALTQCVGSTVFGVDVFDGQGTINWSSAHGAGVQFAIIKATQGTYNTQWTFAHNWSGTKAAGVIRGAYHFFDPTEDGIAQAQHFLAVVGPMGPDDLPPMLDLECPDGTATCEGGSSGWAPAATIKQRALDFLNYVQAATGKRPIIYTYGYWFTVSGVNPSGLNAYSLDVPDLSTAPNCTYVPAPWTSAAFHQINWHAVIPGIPNQTDSDVFMGSLAQLQAFARGTASANGFAGVGTRVMKDASGHLVTFATASNGEPYHDDQSSAGWTGWQGISGDVSSPPSLARDADGRLEAFTLGTNGQVYNAWQTAPSGPWAGWLNMGGSLASTPVAAENADGRLEVFGAGTNGALYHASQITAGGNWTAFSSLGGIISHRLAAARNADGRLEVFAVGTDNQLYHIWQTSPGGAWSGWAPLGGSLASPPAVLLDKVGRVQVAAVTTSGAVEIISQTFSGGAFGGWISLGGWVSPQISLGMNFDGRLEVFVTGNDTQAYHIWQTAPGGGWSAWASLGGGLTSAPTVASNADGRLELFGVGAGSQLFHMWQTSPGGAWSTWASLGGSIGVF